mmetsp:Transcript_7114/g.10374  ORF Transcript_7114/g.10374 Transcript_7114/m.10374 type:complete len:243 (+) Transcript_7114:120-848(+)
MHSKLNYMNDNTMDTQLLLSKVSGHKNFPMKLYGMLGDVEQFGEGSDVISWNVEGDGFLIFNSTKFANTLLIKCFRTNKFSSFQRQLNSYGFKRTNLYASHKDMHSFIHRKFHRDHPELLDQIMRRGQAIKKDSILSSVAKRSRTQLMTPSIVLSKSKKIASASSFRKLQTSTSKFLEMDAFVGVLSDATKNPTVKQDAILDAGTERNDQNDDFYLLLPSSSVMSTTYSLDDWDVEKEALKT